MRLLIRELTLLLPLVVVVGCTKVTPTVPAETERPSPSASMSAAPSPSGLIPAAVPESARATMAMTITAISVSEPYATLMGPVGDRGELVEVAGLSRSDWSQPVVAMPEVSGAVRIVAIDPETGAPESFGAIPDVGETVIATRDPSGDKVYVFGAGLGLVVMNRGGEVARLIAGGAPPEFVNQAFGLGTVEWSASGETLGVSTCSEDTCVAWFVSVSDGSVRRIAGLVPGAVSDDVVLGYASRTDRAWRAVWLDTDERSIVGSPTGVAYDGYFIGPTTAVISGSDMDSELLSVRVVDLAIGSGRTVAGISDGRLLASLWRSERWAVLSSVSVSSLLEAAAQGGAYWDLLDLESGEILERVVPVGF